MAFVFKSEREVSNEKIKTNNILGPGEYLPLTEARKYTVNKEPFLSSMREPPQKINDVPGPGAYYHDETLIKYLKNIQNEKISEQNDKVHLIAKGGSVELHPNTEKIGFNSKSKRFKVWGLESSPGPGQYFPMQTKKKDKASKLREEEYFSKQKIKIKKVNEFQRIPTIPSKIQEFGFEILDNGTLVQKQNPDMYKTFSGEKGDTVGPGSYEIEKPTNWRRTGTEWSKLKVERDFYKKAKTPKNSSTCLTSTNYSETGNNTKNSFYSPMNTNSMKKNIFTSNETENPIPTNLITASTQESAKNKNRITEKNIFKCRILNCMRFNGKKINKKETFESVVRGKLPGPGYYYDPFKTSSFFFKPTPEFKQFFGSKLERFSSINKDQNNLGPGEYFEKNMNKTSIGFAPFSSKTNRFYSSFIPEGKSDIPGPGEYTLKSFTSSPLRMKTNAQTPKAKFGSNVKRFVDIGNAKWKYSIPGPGYYNSEENKSNSNNKFAKTFYGKNIFNLIKNDYNKNNPFRKFIFKKQLKKEKSPPIGTYNPGMIFSIDYNNRKKVFETKNNKVAFKSTFNKKKKNQKNKIDKSDINIGPGYYYHEKKNKDLKPSPQFYISQYQSDKWFKNQNPNVGPGKYDIDNYYEWNKKSFNINFI